MLIDWLDVATPGKLELSLASRGLMHYYTNKNMLELRNGVVLYRWESPEFSLLNAICGA